MKYTAVGSGLLFVILHASATASLTVSALRGAADVSNEWPRYDDVRVMPLYSVLVPAKLLPPYPWKSRSRPVTLSPGLVQSPQKIAAVFTVASTGPPWLTSSGEPPPPPGLPAPFWCISFGSGAPW